MRFGHDWTSQSSSENMTGCLGMLVFKHIGVKKYVLQITMGTKFRQDIRKKLRAPPHFFLFRQSCCGMCHAPGQHPA